MRIAYMKTGTRAGNLRFITDEYVLIPGEIEMDADALPPLDSLHDPGVALADSKTLALAEIDTAAEAARGRYITLGSGQGLTYLRKETQARAFVAAGYTGSVPAMVAATAAGRGITAQLAADTIIAQADAWAATGAQIEQSREGGKKAVNDALDVAGVVAARDAALAALAAI
ncbi:MAG: hypothetical protein OEV94_12025 [Deltaproteobacteria bacterium]|nr:hypothetical protein [Deltaproteobacteria bacterium]